MAQFESEAQRLLARVGEKSGSGNGKRVEEETEAMVAKLVRWSLVSVMWGAFVLMIFLWVVKPTPMGGTLFSTWTEVTNLPYYGKNASLVMIWGGPIFLIVFCGVLYLHLFPRSYRRSMKKKALRASLGTHPVFVNGPFGIVSAAEVLCIVAFSLFITWFLVVSLVRGWTTAANKHRGGTMAMWQIELEMGGMRLGYTAQFCLALLFLPVARGSVLLRLIDIPFEHAAKYHVWLGHLTMSMFSVHGLIFLFSWTTEGKLLANVLQWKSSGVSNLPGVIALIAGLFMWATSFQITRIYAFELFYYTHQLYIVFIVCMALHVGDSIFDVAFAGIFLFTFDRFLRFCQSRQEVGVLSAKVLPCGTFELVLPKPSSLPYNALSFVFLNIPSLSRLQWHPFSVSSSPKDSHNEIKFLIKPLGTWTLELKEVINKAATAKCPLQLKAAVEGPYGHESDYFLDYEAVLFIAGGIGVSPFVAILRDLLQRYQLEEQRLPKDVTLVWAVKTHKELAILNSLSPTAIFPEYASQLNLTVRAYVTQELEANLEAGEDSHSDNSVVSTKYDSGAAHRPLSHLAGSGDILWIGAAIALSLLGYFVVEGIIGKYYSSPLLQESKEVAHWMAGIFACVSILLGVWLFGGTTILVWYLVGSPSTKDVSPATDPLLGNSQEYNSEESSLPKLVQRSNTVYGTRPNLKEVFEGCAKRLSGTNVGVLVCGPEGLQSSVAAHCRDFNTVHYNHDKVAFSYHSVSFDL